MDCNSHRNTLRRAPFTARLRACSEPNNLTIVWPNPYTTTQNKNAPFGAFLFWWEWVDSNHLRLKPTDLQSAPALQLRRTPKSLVRATGNRAYKNTTSCVISNELMFASQGYPTQLHLTYSLGAGSGTRTRISSLEGLHTSPCTMPATNSKPCDYILILPKRKYFSQG